MEHEVCHKSPMVVLIGPPGAGKSTIGRRLARTMNLPLIDSDDLIAEEYSKACGEVFAQLGEHEFRKVEERKVAEALSSGGVVSLGGGAVISEATRERLMDVPVVWVDVSAEEGARRTSGDNTRPVLAAADPAEHYRRLLDTRAPYYREVADFRVRTDKRSPQQVVADILGYLDTF